MTRLLTIDDTAALLSVSVNTVRSLLPQLGAVDIRRGTGRNRTIRIPEESIQAYLRGCGICQPPSNEELRREAKPTKPFRLERRKE